MTYTKSAKWYASVEQRRQTRNRNTRLIEAQLLLAVKTNNGYLPYGIYTSLGSAFGLSRQRIEQIAKRITDKKPNSEEAYVSRHTRNCNQCGKQFIYRGTSPHILGMKVRILQYSH